MNFSGKPKSTDPSKIANILRNKLSEEKEEFLKSFKGQIVPESKTSEGGSVVNEIITQGGAVSETSKDYHQESEQADKKRLAEIEAELQKFRMQRQRAITDYSQKIDSQFEGGKSKSEEVQFIIPKGIDRRSKTPGAGGRGKNKGSGEMIKQKK